MDIRILELIEGAKLAEGLTVVIDVFRAFSLECYLFARGAKEILPVGDINEAFALKREDENRVLIGERHGKKCEGCDFGNSPSQTAGFDFTGRTVVHTTSAGTQCPRNHNRQSGQRARDCGLHTLKVARGGIAGRDGHRRR